MFTGIIEEIGRVARIVRADSGARIEIGAGRVLAGTRVGDSISVDGICLTVVRLGDSGFEVDCSPETLRRTTLGRWREGRPVNLERALEVGARLGGHIVQGHVDGVGELVARRPEGDSVMMRFSHPPELGRHIALKGSIAVSGVSLTVAALGDDWFEVAIIPATLEWTTLGTMTVGESINLETDMLAKYIERILNADAARSTPRPAFTVESLEEMGY
jgi:riboflavin synthase